MRKNQLLLLLFLLCAALPDLSARTGRYRLMWREDPAHTMVVGFQIFSGTHARVLFDVVDHGHNLNAYRYRKEVDRVTDAYGMRNGFVRLGGLQPNTVYYFVVVDSDGPSARYSFQTAPDNPNTRLSIIAGGDSRNFREARRDANLMVSKLRPHCVLFGGDMTTGTNPQEWADWFDDWQLTVSRDGRMYPIIAARGNHEPDNLTLVSLFDLPHSENYYALSLGGNLLRVFTLNTLVPSGGAQKQWLEAELQRSNGYTWKFAQYHHAMRPHTLAKPERDELVSDWATLFHKYGVDLAVECDAHVVKITWPIRPSREIGSQQGFIRDDEKGTVYVGEGCWGAPLRTNDDDKKWTRNSGRFNQFKWIFVDASRVEIRTVMTDGADRVGEVSPQNIFSAPYGLVLWNPSNGDVVTLNKGRASARQVAAAASAGAGSIPLLQCDRAGIIQVGYELSRPGDVNLILINEQMQELARLEYNNQGPGPYTQNVNLSKAPPGRYTLIVKANGEMVKRYTVQR